MITPRSNAGVCAHNNMIYVFCGMQGKKTLNAIERFNAKKFLDE